MKNPKFKIVAMILLAAVAVGGIVYYSFYKSGDSTPPSITFENPLYQGLLSTDLCRLPGYKYTAANVTTYTANPHLERDLNTLADGVHLYHSSNELTVGDLVDKLIVPKTDNEVIVAYYDYSKNDKTDFYIFPAGIVQSEYTLEKDSKIPANNGFVIMSCSETKVKDVEWEENPGLALSNDVVNVDNEWILLSGVKDENLARTLANHKSIIKYLWVQKEAGFSFEKVKPENLDTYKYGDYYMFWIKTQDAERITEDKDDDKDKDNTPADNGAEGDENKDDDNANQDDTTCTQEEIAAEIERIEEAIDEAVGGLEDTATNNTEKLEEIMDTLREDYSISRISRNIPEELDDAAKNLYDEALEIIENLKDSFITAIQAFELKVANEFASLFRECGNLLTNDNNKKLQDLANEAARREREILTDVIKAMAEIEDEEITEEQTNGIIDRILTEARRVVNNANASNTNTGTENATNETTAGGARAVAVETCDQEAAVDCKEKSTLALAKTYIETNNIEYEEVTISGDSSTVGPHICQITYSYTIEGTAPEETAFFLYEQNSVENCAWTVKNMHIQEGAAETGTENRWNFNRVRRTITPEN